MLDFYPDKKEVNLANNDVFEVVSSIADRKTVFFLGMSKEGRAYLDLLYSNSMCRQSSIPTSILIELLLSGGMRYECTHMSFSFATSAIRLETDTRMKYLDRRDCFSSDSVKES